MLGNCFEIHHPLSTDSIISSLAKDLASTLRMKKFYMTNTGKMVLETFHSSEEVNSNKNIHKLEHEDQMKENNGEGGSTD
jgi:hypothetical protein